jgi:cytochrome c oxidase subunit III
VSETQITTEPSFTPTGISSAPAGKVLVPPPIKPENGLTGPQWGMISFLVSEVSVFSTLIVTYLTFMGKDTVGPTPKVLGMPEWSLSRIPTFHEMLVILTTICLLSSSYTIHVAEKALHGGGLKRFMSWWALTILLGVIFLAGTAYEWYELIHVHHLTISRNLFGTTYYTLVGFHAAHVTGGIVVMLIFLGLASRGHLTEKNRGGIEIVGWYWHFVDVVWVVVFIVVYLVSR